MAFAWVVERNFETGDDMDWDTKTDTNSPVLLDFPHYTELARFPDSSWAPASGAFCMRVVASGETNDITLTENDSNISADANEFVKFDINFSSDFTGTADDTFTLFEFRETSGTTEMTMGARIVASTNVINLGIGETAATNFSSAAIQRNRWYTVELDIDVASDSDTGADGSLNIFVTELGKPTSTVVAATAITGVSFGPITDVVLGLSDHLATTTGTILFDNFIHDEARIHSRRDRFPRTVVMTRSGHAFVGPGTIENVTLLSDGNTDNVMRIFDTDRESLLDEANVVVELKNTAANETVDPAGMPVQVHRGCFVALTGTSPRAVVLIGRAAGYGSSAAVRNMGRAIKQLA